MLTDEEKQEIMAQQACFAQKAAVVPEALQIVQHRRGWVADEDIDDLAALLEISTADIEGIATAYNLIFRRPVGRHVILLCDSVSCWIMGYRSMHDCLTSLLKIQLGETTPDNRFTLLTTECLGACDQAPAMLIDGNLHGNLTPEGVEQILAMYQ